MFGRTQLKSKVTPGRDTRCSQIPFGYDRNGNLASYGSNTLTYNASNKWTGGTINGTSVAFGYDGQGRRVSRTVGTERTDYWYDSAGLTLETGGSSATYLRSPEGVLLSRHVSSSTVNYGADWQGHITATTGADGTITSSYSYDPWGKEIGSTGAAYNPFRYAGTYHDTVTGLYQMGARYYQPEIGQFTQKDPLPSQMFKQAYGYTNGNPVNASDPSGLQMTGCFDAPHYAYKRAWSGSLLFKFRGRLYWCTNGKVLTTQPQARFNGWTYSTFWSYKGLVPGTFAWWGGPSGGAKASRTNYWAEAQGKFTNTWFVEVMTPLIHMRVSASGGFYAYTDW